MDRGLLIIGLEHPPAPQKKTQRLAEKKGTASYKGESPVAFRTHNPSGGSMNGDAAINHQNEN